MDESKDGGRTSLRRIVADEARWAALLDLRPDGEAVRGSHDVTDQRRLIFDLAVLPGADDDDAPSDVIAHMTDPTSVYDIIAILCREVLRLRLALHELQWNEGPATN